MKRLTLLVCLVSAYAFGQGGAVTAVPTITNTRGEPVPYAQVAVCSSNPGTAPTTVCNGNFATIYTDITIGTACLTNVTPISTISGIGCTNPGKSDGLGNVIAFAPAGQYWCEYSGGSITRPIVVPCLFANGGSANLNCPTALNGSLGAFTAPTAFSCDPNMGTDFKGNGFAQSWKYLGPVNGFFGVIGGAPDPGTVPAYKLSAHEMRFLAAVSGNSYYARVPGTHCAVGQVWNVTSTTTDGNGDTVDTYGCLTPSANVSITATSPIVVTPSPITGTGVISCPTCGTATYPSAGNPTTPTVTPTGVTGATNYSYVAECVQDGSSSSFHSAPSSAGSTSTGNATLTNSNYNLITGYADSLYAYRGCNIYRTVGGATQGKIATNVGKAFKDTGLTGDGTTAPSTNNTQLDPTGLMRAANQCNSIFHSPEGVDAPPCNPNAMDDEATPTFGAPGDVNDGVWAWGNQGGATAAWTNGELQITPDTTNAYEYLVYHTALPTAPYTFEIYVYVNATGNSTTAGNSCYIGFKESGTGKIVTTEIRYQNPQNDGSADGGFVWRVTNSTSNTPGSSVIAQVYQGNSGYIKMQNDGSSHIKSLFSNDGTNFLTYASQTITVPFTTAPNQLILGALGAGGGSTTCTFDFERRTQ